MCRDRGPTEAVAGAAHGAHEGGSQLATEIADVDLDRVGVAVAAVVPDGVQQFELGDHPVGVHGWARLTVAAHHGSQPGEEHDV
jgi:NADPH-dependent curcumin reductase CurA